MVKSKELRTLAISLNWQQAQLTLASVRSLLALEEPTLDILVVDNGSKDDSLATFAEQAPELEVLALPDNVGFAAGNNAGLRLAIERSYKYALLLNNDAFAGPGLLQRLLAETADDIALLSPKIYFDAERDTIWFAGGRRHPLTIDMRDSGLGETDGPMYQHSRDVDYLVGACMLVNLQAARVVGLFDERYFFYFEDLDWSLRFTEAGYRLRLVADAHVYHRVAASTGGEDDSAQRRYYLARGSVLFWREHAHLGSRAVIVAFRALSGLKMVTRLLLLGRPRAAVAYLRGIGDGWSASTNSRL